MDEDLRTGVGGLGPLDDPTRCKVFAFRGNKKPVLTPV